MKLAIYQVGKDPISELSGYNKKLSQRLSAWQKIEERQFKDQKLLLKKINSEQSSTSFVALEVDGQLMNDDEWLQFYEDLNGDGRIKSLSFVIGEANGISPEISSICNKKLSLGRITLSHGLAKTVLLENLYRVVSRFNKHPFHKV